MNDMPDRTHLASLFGSIITEDDEGICLTCRTGWGKHSDGCAVKRMQDALRASSEGTPDRADLPVAKTVDDINPDDPLDHDLSEVWDQLPEAPEVATPDRADLHRLLWPPHPGGVYESSALCSCGEFQWDHDTPDLLLGSMRAVQRDWTQHVRDATPDRADLASTSTSKHSKDLRVPMYTTGHYAPFRGTGHRATPDRADCPYCRESASGVCTLHNGVATPDRADPWTPESDRCPDCGSSLDGERCINADCWRWKPPAYDDLGNTPENIEDQVAWLEEAKKQHER